MLLICKFQASGRKIRHTYQGATLFARAKTLGTAQRARKLRALHHAKRFATEKCRAGDHAAALD
jgi:hypothetical protein